MRWTVGRKLSTIFIVMIGLILAVSGGGLLSSYKLNENMTFINQRIIPEIESINFLEKTMQNVLGLSQGHILSEDSKYELDYEKQIDESIKNVNENLSTYRKLLQDKSAIEHFDKVSLEWDTLLGQIKEIITLSGANQEQVAIEKSYDAIITLNTINGQLKALNDLHSEESNQIEKQGADLYENVILILAISTAIAILVSIFAVRYLLNNIQKPIVRLSESFKRMATGDLSIPTLESNTNDEIGQLNEDFNKMLTQLKQLMINLHQHIETVASTSVQLSASAEETTLATEQITNSIVDVSEGATIQLESARSSSLIADEITQGMDQAAASIQKVSELAVSTTDFTKMGTAMMDTTVGKMDDIKRSTEMTAEVIEALHKKSTEIGKIVSIISNIAGQTNLLALNASIEAARAGEHGKGFAVVAGEVGGLAYESNSAASDIRILIEEIQREVGGAITAMETSKEFVTEGLEMVQKSGDNFLEISNMISEVSAQAVEISAISEEISASTHAMKQLVGEVATMSERADGNAQEIVAAAEEQNATMEEISSSSTVLSSMAETLKDMVSIFKLK